MNRVLAGDASEFEVGSRKVIEMSDADVLVLRSLSGFWALEDVCSHADFELSTGELEERDGQSPRLKCIHHGAWFDVATGKALSLPAVKAVRTYEVALEDGQVWVIARD